MCLAAVFAVFLLRGGVTFRLSRRLDLLARVFGVIVATTTALISLLLLWTNEPTIIAVLLLCGSIVYLAGLMLWHERMGLWLRFIGWFLIVAVLAFPSTLTLLLPLAALLALTLRPDPEDRTLIVSFHRTGRSATHRGVRRHS